MVPHPTFGGALRPAFLLAALAVTGFAPPAAVASPASIDAIESISTCGAWTTLSPDAPPFKRNQHAMVYDSVHDRLLIFGGVNAGAVSPGNLWTVSLSATPTITMISATGSPPLGRIGSSMIYDASRDRVVIFAGKASLNGLSLGPTVNDVWTLNLTGTPTWTQLTPSGTAPPDRYHHTAIYDVTRDRMVIFGGNNDAVGDLNDVWSLSFSGTPTWTQITPSGTPPAIREGHSAVYDGPRDRMVVFAGYNPAISGQKNDTWALSLSGSGSWTQIVPNGGPPPARYGHTAIVDVPHDRMLVFSGAGDSGQLTDLWSLSFTNPIKWNQ